MARAVEKQHKNLLADIRWYIEAMEDSGELKIQPSDLSNEMGPNLDRVTSAISRPSKLALV